MVNSILHLIVDKGPKQGETLTLSPGKVVRIGRVVKGNTFPIKDTGISQKHLAIEFDPDISRWFVKDLDTSNGTIINGAKIPSSTPFPLFDGDTIKIGEITSISVKIDGDGEVEGGLRRGRGRAAITRAKCSAPVAEDGDGEEQGRSGEAKVKEEPKKVGRGRPRRGNVEPRPGRVGLRTRAASARIAKDEAAGEGNVDAEKENELLEPVVEDNIEPPNNVRRGRLRKAPARTRASSVKVLQADELPPLAEDVSEKKEVIMEEAPAQTRASAAKALQQVYELPQSDSLAEEVHEQREVDAENNAADEAKATEVASDEEKKGEAVEGETTVDFEKMTLGEWFDSMEKYLPEAINEVAEQLIAELRAKARLFDEYVMNDANDG